MNELTIFENPEFGAIRTVELDGAPWLVGKGQVYFINRFLAEAARLALLASTCSSAAP